jgi:glycosyltransferase involved in cell wall biosynthesis/peptidoglycan/xylan/chitin deacetylase (PgdA/CDA1 family)
MKLTIIIDQLHAEHAGTEGQVMKLVRGLAPRHELNLIALRNTDWLTSAAPSLPCPVNVFHIGSLTQPSGWLQVFKLYKHLRRSKPDVVHTFFPIANIFGVVCARLAGVGMVVASRRDFGFWFTPVYLKATRFANKFATAIVCNAEQVKQLTIKAEGYPADRIEVISNGVEIDHLYRDAPDLALKARLGIPADHQVIAIVANFREVKRHDTVIRAAHILSQTRSDFSVLMIGTDVPGLQLKDETFKLAQELGVRSIVHAYHAQDDMPECLSITNIGLNTSESEGLSNAVIEYMCARVPCIVSEGGGNIDLVQDGDTGLLFPVGDHEKLAAQLHRLLDDPAFGQRLAQNALNRVQREMSLPAVLNRFESFYQSKGLRTAVDLSVKPTSIMAHGLVSNAAFGLLSAPPLINRARRHVAQGGVTVFMYHDIGRDDEDVNVWQVIKRGDFERQVDYLRQNYDLVSLDQACKAIAAGAQSERPMATLTFDDGLKGNWLQLLPLMKSLDLPFSVYVATAHIKDQTSFWMDRIVNALQMSKDCMIDLRRHGMGTFLIEAKYSSRSWSEISRLLDNLKLCPVEQCDAIADEIAAQIKSSSTRPVLAPLSLGELRELAASPLVTIGAHTHRHEVLTNLSSVDVEDTVGRSATLLEEWTGQKPMHFAYPCGLHDPRVRSVVEGMGFATAMSGHTGIWRPQDSRFAIPRIAVGRYDDFDRFKVMSVLGAKQLARGALALS